MQNDDITVSEFGDEADDVMTELAAAGFQGMSRAQADLVVRMGKLLDFAARKFAAVIEAGGRNELINRAANHALAMRMHGATLRGISGAELLEDLCDAVMGRYVADPEAKPEKQPKPVLIPDPVPPGCLTVDEALTMLGMNRFAQLAKSLKTSPSMITLWRNQGYIPLKKTAIVREIHSGMQVRAAA
jgi:hypothetical protein